MNEKPRLERLEDAIRECRRSLAAADESKRRERFAQFLVLNNEYLDELRELASTNTEDQSVRTSDDATMPLAKKEATLLPTNDGSVGKETPPPNVHQDTASLVPGTTPGGAVFHNTLDSSSFGDYEVISEIARGGMGVVFKARQISLNRIVALKKVLSGQLAGEQEVQRFRVEAEASANLDHPGIVPVHDFGEVDGQYYFSMGFVEGRSLSDRINESLFEPREAAELLIKISRAVAYANEKGVIHRDLKPGNVLLDSAGEPRVTDFGLAKQQTSDSGMTASGQILGTPSYMPPEQASGKADEADQRADVYALGAILYACLTGRPPFQAANPMETLNQVIDKEPVSVRQLVPNASRDLETICLKCLRKEAGRRYESGNEFADDLQRWLDGEPILARRVSFPERAWKWCKRRPVYVGSIATIVAILVVGSLILWERQNSIYAEGLVQRLRTAEPGQVNEILDELPDYRRWVRSDLRSNYENSREDSIEELHFALGLLSFDNPPIEYVTEQLLTVQPNEFAYIGVIADALGDQRAPVEKTLWGRFHDSTEDESTRFRAGLALAHLDGDDDRWLPEDERFLVDRFVSANAFVQPELLRLLNPLATRLIEPLTEMFADAASSERQQVAAANALAVFCNDEPSRLCELLVTSKAAQFEILFPVYEAVADQESLGQLATLVKQQPNDEMEPSDRISLGRRRAKAAITLLRHGARDLIFDVMRYKNDPEAMTQFIHLCRDFGVHPRELIECLEIVDRMRGQLDVDRKKTDDSVFYALLLALGEFPQTELANSRQELATRLIKVYAQDPSSGVHSATGWLLRQWGFDEPVAEIDQTALPQDVSGLREWYVVEIEAPGLEVPDATDPIDSIYLTMIVFPPGEFAMGSPENDSYHQGDEDLRLVRSERQISVCDRELSWHQLIAKEGNQRRENWNRQFSKTLTLDEPVFGFHWFETIDYCNWLTTQAGMSMTDHCYDLTYDSESGVVPIDLDRPGFRQPTEQEWEYVCRSGSATSYSFGHDAQWLGKYAWSLENSEDWSHPVAELRPNPRGLFDIHGNLYEWCYDLYEVEYRSAAQAPSIRTYRGGSWAGTAGNCRSADRGAAEPKRRSNILGFRVARGPSGQ